METNFVWYIFSKIIEYPKKTSLFLIFGRVIIQSGYYPVQIPRISKINLTDTTRAFISYKKALEIYALSLFTHSESKTGNMKFA